MAPAHCEKDIQVRREGGEKTMAAKLNVRGWPPFNGFSATNELSDLSDSANFFSSPIYRSSCDFMPEAVLHGGCTLPSLRSCGRGGLR